MPLKVGDLAPGFTLVDTEKNKVSLSDERGNKVLLLFFPMAFTGVCTTELCSVRDNIGQYEQVNAKVFGISVDSPFTLAKFKEDQKLNFPLLSDFNKEVSENYGCIYDAFIGWMKGVSKRAAFLIDEKGFIQYAEVLESAGDLPDFKAIKDVLEKKS
ncbi:MAG: redoxin domain-containing protein [Bacteroidota bacterium]